MGNSLEKPIWDTYEPSHGCLISWESFNKLRESGKKYHEICLSIWKSLLSLDSDEPETKRIWDDVIERFPKAIQFLILEYNSVLFRDKIQFVKYISSPFMQVINITNTTF